MNDCGEYTLLSGNSIKSTRASARKTKTAKTSTTVPGDDY